MIVKDEQAENDIKILIDALTLRDFNVLSTLTVPIQNPGIWEDNVWSDCLEYDVRVYSFKRNIVIKYRHLA